VAGTKKSGYFRKEGRKEKSEPHATPHKLKTNDRANSSGGKTGTGESGRSNNHLEQGGRGSIGGTSGREEAGLVNWEKTTTG